MTNSIDSKVQLHNRTNRRRRAWHRVVTTLGCIVIFVTTYALILPAITLEATLDTYCGQEEHQHDDSCWEVPGEPARTELSCDVSVHCHTEDCYDESGMLICTQGDYLVHQHDSFCFDEGGELICTLPEQDLHEHEESCYDEAGQLVCGKYTPLRHQHTSECVITIPATEPQGLLCTLPEHTHTEACFVQEGNPQSDDETPDADDDESPGGSEEEAESDDFSELLEALNGRHMADLTEEEFLALREFALAEMPEEDLAQLSEEDISTLMQQALISLGGLPDEEEDNLPDKSLLEMTGAELASLTDEEITARTEEFLTLTDEEFESLNLRMAQTAIETTSNDALSSDVSADELTLLGLGNGTGVQTASVDLDGTITITDDVANTGCYIASYSGGTEGVTFKWYRTDAGGTESAVARKFFRVGDVVTSNMSGDSLENLNLALDGGGITNSRSSVTYRAVLCVDGVETDVAGTIINTTYQGEVLNGSFETPDLADYEFQEFVTEGTAGLYWKTTADNEETGNSVYSGGTSQTGGHYIEIIDTSTSAHKSDADTWHSQGTASDGTQYAEINAGATGALYQTVITTPGLTMSWQVDHMARTRSGSSSSSSNRYNGTDSMYVVIMDTKKAAALADDTAKVLAVAEALASGQTTVDGVDYSGASATLCASVSQWTSSGSGRNKTYTNSCTWQTHSGTYTVPAGQYRTTYFFVSASTASGNNNVGNHVDNVWFSLESPTPAANDAKLELNKNVYGDLDETALNELLYSLKFNLIRNSDNTVLRTVYAYELGSWSKQDDGSWQLSKTISVTNLLGETIRVEEAEYALEGFKVTAEGTADPFTVEESQSYTATFSNTYTSPNCALTMTKHVSASDTSGTFEITASYQNGTQTIEKSFELGNNDSSVLSDIPTGAWVTVSEPKHDGYTVRITDSAGTQLTDSDWYSFTITEDTEIHIYNTAGVLLPQTGGASSYLFIYSGLLLMLTAVMTGFVLRRKWGKEGSE